MMGSLLSTSTWYILMSPELTLAQVGTLLMSFSMGLVSHSGLLFLTCWAGMVCMHGVNMP